MALFVVFLQLLKQILTIYLTITDAFTFAYRLPIFNKNDNCHSGILAEESLKDIQIAHLFSLLLSLICNAEINIL